MLVRSVSLRRAIPSSNTLRRCFLSTQLVESPASDEYEPHMMLILGKPGGGKGTISGKLLKDFPKLHHVSTGDLLRQNVREQTQLGKQAKQYMDHGALVPDEFMIELVMEDAGHYLEEGKCLLLDGFPRTLQQARALEDATHIDTVINLDIPTETIVSRIADRWIHPASGRIYSYSYKPPKVAGKDDITGEPLVQRDDDRPESVRKRLQAYDQVTAPLVEYYREQGVLKTFTGTMSDIIYPEVKEWLETEKKLSGL
jgi:nucleoside-triphosphate--adenylate kinase